MWGNKRHRHMPAGKALGAVMTGALLLSAALAPVTSAAAPHPTDGSAVVDGATAEWSLSTDHFGDMTDAGVADRPVRAKLYVRYDCDAETLFALVLVQGDEQGRQDRPDEAYLRIDGEDKLVGATSGNDGTPPDFAWINGDGTLADGYEASGELEPGTYTLRAHILVADDSADGYTPMDVVGRAVPLVIECGEEEPTDGEEEPTDGEEEPTDGGEEPTDGQEEPVGGVGGATGRPRTTLPPTDALVGTEPTTSGDGVRVALVLLASAVGVAALVTPTRRRRVVEETNEAA